MAIFVMYFNLGFCVAGSNNGTVDNDGGDCFEGSICRVCS